MDKRSTEILKKIKQCLVKGSLSAYTFPKDDILQMLQAEYEGWLNERVRYLDENVTCYEKRIDAAIKENDPIVLSDLLKELIDDLRRTPSETPASVIRVRNREDALIIETFKRWAKLAYDHYPFHSAVNEKVFTGKGVIYTVITGNYDVLREPEYVCPEFDYICFTDNKEQSSEIWNMRYIENREGLDSVRFARKLKILCHEILPEYDYSVYVDGKMQIVGNIKEYVEKYDKGSPMLCFPHPARQCAYEEASVCSEREKDDPMIIGKQMDEYRREGYPEHNGLIDSACLVRRHDDENLQKVMECWWQEIRKKSKRDQLSFNYACWKNNFHYGLCDLFICVNEYIRKRRDSEKAY